MEKINLTVAIPWILTLVTAGAGIWQFTVQQGQISLSQHQAVAFAANPQGEV